MKWGGGAGTIRSDGWGHFFLRFCTRQHTIRESAYQPTSNGNAPPPFPSLPPQLHSGLVALAGTAATATTTVTTAFSSASAGRQHRRPVRRPPPRVQVPLDHDRAIAPGHGRRRHDVWMIDGSPSPHPPPLLSRRVNVCYEARAFPVGRACVRCCSASVC
ncbi:hypothetical protein DFJ73DRAFT_857681, partial [Zopfochytrium polystomum]